VSNFTARLKSYHPAVYWAILSGTAALIYQVVLQKVFSYVLGGALLSTTIVVAAYMSGLALGGFLTGRFSDRLSTRANLLLYVVIETGIAVFGTASLIGYSSYVSIESRLTDWPFLVYVLSSIALRATLALLALLPMTILMGATLPILTLAVRARTGDRTTTGTGSHVTISALYSANLLGGLAGVAVSAYLVMPLVGLWGATALAGFANLTIALLVFRFRSSAAAASGAVEIPATDIHRPKLATGEAPSFALVCFLGFISGLIMFSLEILWTHLLGAVIGCSVFAFANMLMAVFIALWVAARREERIGPESNTPLSALVLWGGILLALSVPFYALSPFLFSLLGLVNPDFIVREVARFAVACFLIIPTGVLLSRIFPRLLAVGVPNDRKGRGVGYLLAINTFGCLLGLFFGNFFLIPVLGSQIALKSLAVLLSLVAWIVYRRNPAEQRAHTGYLSRFGFAIPLAAMLCVIVPSWRPAWFLSNRAIYFRLSGDGEYKPLLYLGEDAESGFVTVATNSQGYNVLRTNGKFQGDDKQEMSAQFAFGYLPALAAPRSENAFVIGCGTGVTVRAFADSGFKHIWLAEISKPILHAARTYFGKANGHILDDPRVTVVHDDGRNALALSPERFDVISVEISNIWFAGAGNVYSSDFYSIVQKKLVPGGVFEQWVQFHHMRLEDLYVVINTVHRRFKHVGLWYDGEQAQIMASDEPLSLDWARMRNLAAQHVEGEYISTEDIFNIPYRVTLDEAGADQFTSLDELDQIVGHGIGKNVVPAPLLKLLEGRYVHSDLFPYLEYATPHGNLLPNQELLIPRFIAQTIPGPVQVPFRNLPASDLPFAQALLAYENGECDVVSRLQDSDAISESDRALLGAFKACTPQYSLHLVIPATAKVAAASQ
jgi:spermidine synthase